MALAPTPHTTLEDAAAASTGTCYLRLARFPPTPTPWHPASKCRPLPVLLYLSSLSLLFFSPSPPFSPSFSLSHSRPRHCLLAATSLGHAVTLWQCGESKPPNVQATGPRRVIHWTLSSHLLCYRCQGAGVFWPPTTNAHSETSTSGCFSSSSSRHSALDLVPALPRLASPWLNLKYRHKCLASPISPTASLATIIPPCISLGDACLSHPFPGSDTSFAATAAAV